MVVLRFGILSAARIAEKFIRSCKVIDGARCDVVASRSERKAKDLAERYGIPRTCTYDQLLQDKEVDAVYIPLPTALATEWAVRFALAGKHILVDKPFGSAEEVQAIIDAATTANVVFLDGTHFVHAERTKYVKKSMAEKIGKVTKIMSSFSIFTALDGNIRGDPSLEPLGALGDLGWYCCRAAVTLLGTSATREIRTAMCDLGTSEQHPNVLIEAKGIIVFDGDGNPGPSLCFDCDFYSALRQTVEVVGTLGTIRITDFVEPEGQYMKVAGDNDKGIDNDFEVALQRTTPDWYEWVPSRETISVKETYKQASLMIAEFVRLANEKDYTSQHEWNMETLQTQKMLDALLRDGRKRLRPSV